MAGWDLKRHFQAQRALTGPPNSGGSHPSGSPAIPGLKGKLGQRGPQKKKNNVGTGGLGRSLAVSGGLQRCLAVIGCSQAVRGGPRRSLADWGSPGQPGPRPTTRGTPWDAAYDLGGRGALKGPLPTARGPLCTAAKCPGLLRPIAGAVPGGHRRPGAAHGHLGRGPLPKDRPGTVWDAAHHLGDRSGPPGAAGQRPQPLQTAAMSSGLLRPLEKPGTRDTAWGPLPGTQGPLEIAWDAGHRLGTALEGLGTAGYCLGRGTPHVDRSGTRPRTQGPL